MTLFEEIKKLRAISADREYTLKSRRIILSHTPHAHPLRAEAFALFFRAVRAGSTALVSGAFIILLILGGVAASRFFSPMEFGGLEGAAIRAEADLIDIQIQLTELGEYKEEALIHPESTLRTEPALKLAPVSVTSTEPEQKKPVTLDAALDLLAE